MTIFFDRSRRADHEKCPRKRYWGYEYKGRGIQPVGTSRSDWPLLTGIGIHQGIGELAQGMAVDNAVVEAKLAAGYVFVEDEKQQAGQWEQLALIEAIVRCWAVNYLPKFRAEFEVLAVEREEQVELAPGVVMMVRPDMVVRRRADNALFTWQLKSAKRIDQRWCEQWPLDQMTISEVMAVDTRLQREFEQKMTNPNAGLSGFGLERVSGVIVQGLVKGDSKEYQGEWYVNSPLIRAWRKQSDKPHPMGDWSARWGWEDESGKHTLGKGWRLVPVWTDYPGGVKAWIEWLAANDPSVLEQQVVTLQPILRAPHEMERWKRSVVASEVDIRFNRYHVTEGSNLDELFPMHTSSGNCVWPFACQFKEICWGMAQPDDEQLFKPRALNHKQEILETK